MSLWWNAKEEASLRIDCDEDEAFHDLRTWIFKNLRTFELVVDDTMSIQKFGRWIPLTHGTFYKKHHVFMSIKKFHALNSKELTTIFQNSCYKWRKIMEIYILQQGCMICVFFLWLLFCHNYIFIMILFFFFGMNFLLLCSITMLFCVLNRVVKSREVTWTTKTNVSKLKFNIRTNDAFESVKLMTNKEIN